MAAMFRAAALVGAAALAAGAHPASAAPHPFGVEDLLRREALGDAVVTAGDRWLVLAHKRAYATSARFDFELFGDAWRTNVCRVDLRRPGPCRDLAAADARHGYILGPASPDGTRVALIRIDPRGRTELGVAKLATGRIHWLGVAPRLALFERTLQWRTSSRLLVIAEPPGAATFLLRWGQPQGDVPARWAARAHGQAAVTLVGSGRFRDLRPHDPPRRLVEIDLASGGRRTLAEGALSDIELSPSAQTAAVFSDAEGIPLQAHHAVQGDYGVATFRRRVRLLDLTSGAQSPPAPWDILGRLVSWSHDNRLLVFGRPDGAPWQNGKLLVFSPGQASPAILDTQGVVPEIRGRPEQVAAGWLGSDPILFGRPATGRADWYRIAPGAPINLTASLPTAPRDQVALADKALLAVSAGRAWRIDPQGRTRDIGPAAGPAVRPAQNGLQPRSAYQAPQSPIDVLDASGRNLLRLGGVAPQALELPAVGDVVALAHDRLGALLRLRRAGLSEELVWVEPNHRPRTVLLLNRALADVVAPEIRAVRHPGPSGETLTSWVLLPALPPGSPAPPLVVWPYLGAVYPTSPFMADAHNDTILMQPAVLVGAGYAVLLPSLPYPPGPDHAAGLADRVLAIVSAAQLTPDLAVRFDASRLAVWGHSYGGYSTLALITQTSRFRAAIADASISDLFSMEGTFETNRRPWPEEGVSTPYTAGWTEDLQGGTEAPPWAAADRYLRNSPALQADRITTPLLLTHGEQDGIPLQQSEEMFSALFRQDKDAVLMTFWGEGHSLSSPGNLRIYYQRTLDWLDGRLREDLQPGAAAQQPKNVSEERR